MIRLALLLPVFLAVGCKRELDQPAAATTTLFSLLSENRVHDAFGGTSFFFQHQQSESDFRAIVHEMGLLGCTVVKSEIPTIAGRTAKQLVTIRTHHGTQFPLVVTLSKDRGVWSVFSVKSPMNIETGISENPFTRLGRGPEIASVHDHPLPNDQAAVVLAKETMLQFHDAIQQKSFEEFYDGVARAWQRQLTLGMLTRTFDGFIKQRTNLIAIKDLEAVLKTPPRIDSEGLLIIAGSYMTRPHRIDFDIRYYYELPNWRPFGVAVSLIQ